ncbi:GNAT family N-acetyltransferase [Clostridium beijerinckii]|uniref:GNAT family N-acetyltransferase n=1 Tax=Clostridium beijerinckii TaxID=1520 RepID=UPI001F218FBE|nr:GNAT family protein [Clostridium beijerinckii]
MIEPASKKDCDLLFNWANDEDVRKNSFNSGKIIYQEHIKWFSNVINSNECFIFILKFKDISVGQIRINVKNKKAIISYSIDKNYRGQGLSMVMLNLLEQKIKDIDTNNIDKLVGFVKYENIASQKVFEGLKYNKTIHNEFVEYEKYLV